MKPLIGMMLPDGIKLILIGTNSKGFLLKYTYILTQFMGTGFCCNRFNQLLLTQ